ncbi:eCIS core domain-containing protein [Granulosicoccus sp. 3-233]|uniref:eCIS core domain-containing protein n=1 Tax=Granulosicoccus sp. 3-233 TaxID=3417969 RepID=UPI003D344AF1
MSEYMTREAGNASVAATHQRLRSGSDSGSLDTIQQRQADASAVGDRLRTLQRYIDRGTDNTQRYAIQPDADTPALQCAELDEEELLQGKFSASGLPVSRVEVPAKDNALPEVLRSGIERLSGDSMAGVRVHRNSNAPAAVSAHAYAQGDDIHLAPNQERHLPHEAWHVVQQRQGRVKPTAEVSGRPVNDDVALEREADIMGQRALNQTANDHDLN